MSKRPAGNLPDRRQLLQLLSATAAGSLALPDALFAADEGKVTADLVRQAEWTTGLTFDDGERALMLDSLNENFSGLRESRAVALPNGVAPALRFSPVTEDVTPPRARPRPSGAEPAGGVTARPTSDDELAFATLRQLASLLKRKKLSSVELTKVYLDRLKRFDPVLKCVITFTEETALKEARKADEEIAAGKYRGPLHGVPWGAKDLISVPGYPTTWGSPLYRDLVRPERATVAAHLAEAGAVLVAKTSVGELAWGDVWFGGTTKNPWKVDQGSSGSSAGSASATAAGLVGFAIGTETLGSIVSPCTRCGASGLRPTFGRVSRHGVMALSPSMDKVGPIARTIDDCGLVFQAIEGRDPLDPHTFDAPFDWPSAKKLKELKVGFPEKLFEEDRSDRGKTDAEKAAIRAGQENDRKTLDALRSLGVNLVPMKLPGRVPIAPLGVILTVEAAAFFDELTRTSQVKKMVRQTADAWPNVFRLGQLIPAVEYVRANRIRTLLMREMDELMKTVDVYVSPTYGGSNLLLTNLTGHPAAVVPNGFRADGTPTSITFTGRLFGEAELLTVAWAYQESTGFHKKHPVVSV